MLFDFIKSVIDDLIAKRIVIAGTRGDNASVNGAIAKKFTTAYPWILPLPCASHTLQLCVVRLFEKYLLAYLLIALTQTNSHSDYEVAAAARSSSDEFKEQKVLNLTKPQKTRWSSYYKAFLSLLKVQTAVELALRGEEGEEPHPLLGQLDVEFWLNLKN